MKPHPSIKRVRTVLQVVELEEFAALKGLKPTDNEAVRLWIEEGHAAKFDKHFDIVIAKVELKGEELCNLYEQGDPSKRKLRKKLHRLMKDKRDW